MYRYLMGHCRSLSEAEIRTIDRDSLRKGPWIVSQKDIDIQNLGSIVLKAEQVDEDQLQGLPKKIGLVCSSKDFHRLLKEYKSNGARKVRHVTSINDFKYGHWKACKEWFVIDRDITLKIIDVFDQEPWSKVDYQLPHRDLRRGIINLKLARSLISLSGSEYIWDPFAGQGRMAIAGSGLVSHIILSDIDPEVISQARENYEYSKEFFKMPILEGFFEHDTRSQDIIHSSLPDTVVTEGYLGKTFSRPPTEREAREQLKTVYAMWQQVLPNWHKIDIEHAVICLPWYPKLRILPREFKLLAFKCGYTLDTSLSLPILYSRARSNTGHAVFILHRAS